MSIWGKMGNKWHRERAVMALRRSGRHGLEALGLHEFFWSWVLDEEDAAVDQLSGFIPEGEIAACERRAAALLVSAGLWRKAEGGYEMVAFEGQLPDLAAMRRKRAADRERIAEKRAHSDQNVARDTHATRTRVAASESEKESEKEKEKAPPPAPVVPIRSRAPAPAPVSEVRPLSPAEAPPIAAAVGAEGYRGPHSLMEGRGPEYERARAAAWAHSAAFLGERPERTPAPSYRFLEGVTPAARGGTPASEPPQRLAAEPPLGPHGAARRDAMAELMRVGAEPWSVFRALYQKRFGNLPNMHARAAGDFPERVLSLAEARAEPPRQLLERAFEAWCAQPPKEDVGRDFPYSNFVLRFERLVGGARAGAASSHRDAQAAQLCAALAAGDFALYDKLNAEFAKQGGKDAKRSGGEGHPQ